MTLGMGQVTVNSLYGQLGHILINGRNNCVDGNCPESTVK